MAGFSSLSNLQSAIRDSGKCREHVFAKTGVATSSGLMFADYFTGSGNPGGISLSGTAGVATALSNTTSGALLPLSEGNVSTDKRFILEMDFFSDATAANFPYPGVVILMDLLLYYPACSSSSSETTLDNTVTLPRYTNGEGVLAIVKGRADVVGTPSMTFTFTANDNSSQTTVIGHPLTDGRIGYGAADAGASETVPFGAIPNGKLGIKKIDSYVVSGGVASSTFDLLLVKPLLMMPIYTRRAVLNRDFTNTMIEVSDGACLGMIVRAGGVSNASASTLYGRIKYGWN